MGQDGEDWQGFRVTKYAMKHAEGHVPTHSASAIVEPIDLRRPGVVFLQQELDANRRSERWIVLKAVVAIALVAVLVVVREVFFA